MEATSVRPGYELWRPNREKSETKTTKFLVSFVLLVSAGLLIVITIGGWSRLEGASVGIATLIWAGLYIVFAFLVGARWQRGVLPVASALAIILAIFAAVAAPAWFDRNKPGLSGPALPDDLLGLVSIQPAGALVPELDVALEILADDRGLGGRLEHIANEVGGGIRIGKKGRSN